MNKKSIANISHLETETFISCKFLREGIQRTLSKSIYFLYTMLKLMCVDPSLGRLDYDSLSDQALMETLVEGMNRTDKRSLQDGKGNFKDISAWRFIKCTDDRVTQIYAFQKTYAKRQFPFEFIPSQVSKFSMILCGLYGTLDTSQLPLKLTRFNVPQNALYGSITGFQQNSKISDPVYHHLFCPLTEWTA